MLRVPDASRRSGGPPLKSPGVLVGMLTCMLALAFLVLTRPHARAAPEEAPSASPTFRATATTALRSPMPTPATATLRPRTSTPTVTPTRPAGGTTSAPRGARGAAGPPSDPEADFQNRLARISSELSWADALIRQQRYAEAIPFLNRAIAIVPEYREAYSLRGKSYHNLMKATDDSREYLTYLGRALVDFSRAIELGSQGGNDYLDRSELYESLAALERYRVDQDHLNRLALADLRQALRLGNRDPLSERFLPLLLFKVGRCSEGLAEVERLLAARPRGGSPNPALLYLQSLGYACSGDSEQALKALEASLVLSTRDPARLWQRALLLTDLERSPEALKQVNDLIDADPEPDASHFFLRALVHLQEGRLDLARRALAAGEKRSSERAGLHAYVQGMLALATGNRVQAIERLQMAEATLSSVYDPFRRRARQGLAELGARPLTPGLSPRFLPTATPTPTPAPTRTPTPTPDPWAALLAQARRDLSERRPVEVRQALLPRLPAMTDPAARARALEYLGQAELLMAHYDLAAGYFEQLYKLEAVEENLFLLATAYDLGGRLELALEKYRPLLRWDDPGAEEYRQFIADRVRELTALLRTPTPAAALSQ